MIYTGGGHEGAMLLTFGLTTRFGLIFINWSIWELPGAAYLLLSITRGCAMCIYLAHVMSQPICAGGPGLPQRESGRHHRLHRPPPPPLRPTGTRSPSPCHIHHQHQHSEVDPFCRGFLYTTIYGNFSCLLITIAAQCELCTVHSCTGHMVFWCCYENDIVIVIVIKGIPNIVMKRTPAYNSSNVFSFPLATSSFFTILAGQHHQHMLSSFSANHGQYRLKIERWFDV